MRNLMLRIGRLMAMLGGLVLVGLVVITCVSVLGRIGNTLGHNAWLESAAAPLAALFRHLGPVRGDFELVEAGVAFAIFAFFPWCQLKRGHATVDLFTQFLPQTGQRFLAMLWEVLLALVIAALTWRLIVGTLDKADNGETTFLLQFPVWWGFALCAFAATVASVVALYVAAMRVRELFTGVDSLIAPEAGAEH